MITIYEYRGEYDDNFWRYLMRNGKSQVCVGDTLTEMFEDTFGGNPNNSSNDLLINDGFEIIFKCANIKKARKHFMNEYPEEFI